MVAPRKGPAGIAAPPPAVITAPPADPTPVQEVGFDIVFDEVQFKEFVERDPSGETQKLDFSIIVPADFANAVVAAARNKAGNDTPTVTQWIEAAAEKARRVKPAVDAGKLTEDQGACVLIVILFMVFAAARKRGDSIESAMKIVEKTVDELSKPVVAPSLPKVDPAAMTVEAPKTPAPASTGSPAPADSKIKLVKPTGKPPATSNPSGRRSTTPTDVMEKVGAAAAEGGFGDSIRPDGAVAKAEADAKRQAEADKAEANRKKADFDRRAAEAEAERQAKQAERERLLAEARAKADADKAEAKAEAEHKKAEADRKRAEAEAKAEVAKAEKDLRAKRAAKLRGDRLRLIAAHTAARATVNGPERAQLDAEHKAALLELDAELANLGAKPSGNSGRFTKVVFTIIGLLLALGLVLGVLKLAESLPASAQQPIPPTVTVPPVAPMPGVETCGPVTAALLEYYLGGNDPAHYVDRGQKYAKNGARLQCEGRQRNLGNNSYDVSACNICYTP